MDKPFIPLNFNELSADEMRCKSSEFLRVMQSRRSVRDFSTRDVDASIIRNAIQTAGSAPSGANKQPWHFVAISNSAVKKQIRLAAEQEEREFYQRRAPQEWLDDLQPFGTDANKPLLEDAPYLIAVFLKKFSIDEQDKQKKNYYTSESVGIATGFLLTALHQSGLATLTHTPSPMKFLHTLLNRPSYEKAYMLIVTGYPKKDAKVPNITKHSLDEIATFI